MDGAVQKRWTPGKCEAHIHVDSKFLVNHPEPHYLSTEPKKRLTYLLPPFKKGSLTYQAQDQISKTEWRVKITDAAGAQINYDWAWQNVGVDWTATDPERENIRIKTETGYEFWIGGYAGEGSGRDALMLSYDTQHWSSADCRDYTEKQSPPAAASNSEEEEGWQYDWFCPFDCLGSKPEEVEEPEGTPIPSALSASIFGRPRSTPTHTPGRI